MSTLEVRREAEYIYWDSSPSLKSLGLFYVKTFSGFTFLFWLYFYSIFSYFMPYWTILLFGFRCFPNVRVHTLFAYLRQKHVYAWVVWKNLHLTWIKDRVMPEFGEYKWVTICDIFTFIHWIWHSFMSSCRISLFASGTISSQVQNCCR